jgi:hypothetical protein
MERYVQGKSRTVRFPVRGEGGYLVVATLADGRVLTGTEGYIESGYSTKVTITQDGIASTPTPYAL